MNPNNDTDRKKHNLNMTAQASCFAFRVPASATHPLQTLTTATLSCQQTSSMTCLTRTSKAHLSSWVPRSTFPQLNSQSHNILWSTTRYTLGPQWSMNYQDTHKNDRTTSSSDSTSSSSMSKDSKRNASLHDRHNQPNNTTANTKILPPKLPPRTTQARQEQDHNGTLHQANDTHGYKDCPSSGVLPSTAVSAELDTDTDTDPQFKNRWAVIALLSSAFVLANMDKVNMSVGVVAMAQQYNWSASDVGLVCAAFFWGYVLSTTPAGLLVLKFGGLRVMLAGVFLWSVATMAVPTAASHGIAVLCLARFLTGLGEGVAPSSAANVIAKIVPQEFRARAVTLVWGGLDLGSVVGFLVAGHMIARLGWPSVFVTFGLAGLVWMATAVVLKTESVVQNIALNEVQADKLMNHDDNSARLPWKAIATSGPMYALATAHFCYNYAFYVILAWLPSYFDKALGLDIAKSSLFTLLPYLAALITTPFVGPTADLLIYKKGWPVTTVRKLVQAISFVVPAICLASLALLQPSNTHVDPTGSSSTTIPLILFVILGSSTSWARAGLYCNHQDLSPKYAGALMGVTNTIASVPGIAGIWIVGWLLDHNGDWNVALLLPIILTQMLGVLVYTAFGSSEKADWG